MTRKKEIKERVTKTLRLLPDTANYLDKLAVSTTFSQGQIVDLAIASFKAERDKGNKFEVEI
jgi:predicted transcriptional regulator